MTSEEAREMHKCVAVFSDHTDAEAGVRALRDAGFEMKHLSIVGRDYHTEEHVTGFYNVGDRMKHWGKFGAFWGGLFGILFAPAFFFIPGIGPIMTGGILGSAVMGTVEGGLVGAAVVGGLTALGAGLLGIGIPKDSVIAYETALKADKYLLILHGSEDEVQRARKILAGLTAETKTFLPS